MAKVLHTGGRSKLMSSNMIASYQESKTDEELVSHLDGGKSQLMVPRLDMFKLPDQS